jgi:mevalonate kinase
MASRTTHAAASAPGKVVLLGEHGVERGQAALAAAVALFVRCRISLRAEEGWMLRSGATVQETSAEQVQALHRQIDQHRAGRNAEAMRGLSGDDPFMASKYILGTMFGPSLPKGMEVEWESQVPAGVGLGAGGAAFAALVTAAAALLPSQPPADKRATWAQLGEVCAHGEDASSLDTQASLQGGVVRFIGRGAASRVPCGPGLAIVIGNTGEPTPHQQVIEQVRTWTQERPQIRNTYFETIGALSRSALQAIQRGDWPEVGRLMNLNQLVLEKIGVSTPQVERLIDAAWAAGALGAKVSGTGGGGIMIALVSSQTRRAVADAIAAAGGTALTPEVPARGAMLEGG